MKDNFLIYNASAGSGKTYTLTKVYLSLILAPQASLNFGQILALTFTNKAVNEMKARILQSLSDFSKDPCPEKSMSLFKEVAAGVSCSEAQLRVRAKKTLEQLLHNYAFFEVSTIDKFNHRLIRTFAKDLKLPQNFEVQLDSDLILSEGVNALIERAGNDAVLTEILVAFALEKISEDKSWDLSYDLNNIGKLLFSDAHIKELEHLSKKKLSDFEGLKKILKSKILESKTLLVDSAKSMQALIEESSLVASDFTRKSLPKFLEKIINGGVPDTKAKWINEFEDTKLQHAKTPKEAAETIVAIQPQLSQYMALILSAMNLQYFHVNAHKHLLSLRLINALQYQIKTFCEAHDYLPISEFNKRIQGAIKDQSVPFIYERMGEQYRHFFIDEFQDTSVLQWENLKPLLENAVLSEDEKGDPGALLLVGDAKQAIYRWRGGNAEQFISLYENQGFPAADPKVIQLPKNYRSDYEIVHFNNQFFKYTADYLEQEHFKFLYDVASEQTPDKNSGGFVSLAFIDADEQKDRLYCEAVLANIHKALEKGYSYGDICILTRKKKHGILVAQYLIDQKIPVISSESLLLDKHPKVQFLVQLIQYVFQETTAFNAYPLLVYLAKQQQDLGVHQYVQSALTDGMSFFKNQFGFNPDQISSHSLYDFCTMAIRCFSLANGKDAYLQYFLDTVSEVEIKEGAGSVAFLEYWAQKKTQLSITAPEGINAIQILTVHKSKGLQFPVVIFPFAETPLKEERNPSFWLPVSADEFNGFDYLLLNKNDTIGQYNPLAKQLIEQENERLVLDALNLLYVALTRAEKALFVIGGWAINQDGSASKSQYSGLLIDYLMTKGIWKNDQDLYRFGQFEAPQKKVSAKGQKNKNTRTIPFQNQEGVQQRYALLTHPNTLLPERVLKAQSFGQQFHYLLEQLESLSMEAALEKTSAAYPQAQADQLRVEALGVIEHPLLKKYFQKGVNAFNERDIFTEMGAVVRPDRLVFNGNKVTIIDYKTGGEKAADQAQIESYAALLEKMGFQVENKILVYVALEKVQPIFV